MMQHGNYNGEGAYTEFEVIDPLVNYLTIDNINNITVKDEDNQDMTRLFDISLNDNNELRIRTSSERYWIRSRDFYGHFYRITIPVHVNRQTGLTVGTVDNSGHTAFAPNGTIMNTNTVSVGLKYDYTITSSIDNPTGRANEDNETNINGSNAISVNSAKLEEKGVPHGQNKNSTVNFKVKYGYEIDQVIVDGNSVPNSSLTQTGKDSSHTYYSYIFSDYINQNMSHSIKVTTKRKETSVLVKYVYYDNGVTKEFPNTAETIRGYVFDPYTTYEKSIPGYTCRGTPQNATGTMEEEQIIVIYVYDPYSAQVIVAKKDNQTRNTITKEDTTFVLYEWNNGWVPPIHINNSTINGRVSDGGVILKQKTNGTKGTYETIVYYDLINQGKFKVVEYARPYGYTTSDWQQEFIINVNGPSHQTFEYTPGNNQVRGQINFKKNDVEVNYKNESYDENFAQGDGSLQGAVYGVYAKGNILSPDDGHVLYRDGQQVTVGTTDVYGKITWNDLYLGKYYIQEISPSIGYLKDEAKYEVDLQTYYSSNYFNKGDQTTGNIVYKNTVSDAKYENSEQRVISKETVKRQSFQLTKLSLAGDSTMGNPLQGAGFKIYLIKDLSAVKNGMIQPDASGNYNATDLKRVDYTKEQTALDFSNNINGERIPELFSNEDGTVSSPELAYGKYIIIESTVPEGLQAIEPFIVDIYEDSRNPKNMVYPIDREFEARIKIIKKDDTTGRTVLKASAAYRIWDMQQNEYVEQWVTYPSKVQYGTESNPYRTTEEGYLLTPDRLGIGEYELREVEAPEGYVIAGKEEIPKSNVRFSINTNVVYEMDPDLGAQNAIISVEQRNMPQLGTITVSKSGEFLSNSQEQENQYQFEYSQRAVKDAKFAIYAKEDIYTKDNQVDENGERTKIYEKNQFIMEVETNTEGKAIFEKLPLGQYIIVETKAGEGFTLNTERKEVSLTYEGQDKPIIYRDMEYVNERQKIQIAIHKIDRQDGTFLQGAKFGLYTKEVIRYTDNSQTSQMIPADKLIAEATSGKDGMVIFKDGNLPLGKYYIKELEAPQYYATNPEIIDVDCTYENQEVDKIVKQIDFTNKIITLKIKVIDYETTAGLRDTQISLKDENNNTIGTYTVDGNGEIEVKGIEAGKQYSIEEVKQRNGYVKDFLFKNNTSDPNELIKAKDENGFIIFQIKDSQETQTVTVSNISKVGQIAIEKTGEVLVGVEKDENENYVFRYETQRIDTAKFEIYAKENIVHPDGKQGIIISTGTNIGEGYTKDGILKITKIREELIQEQPKIVQLLLNRGLPLGQYDIKETEVPEGYVIKEEEQTRTVKVESRNDYDEVEVVALTIYNLRQRTNIGEPNSDDPDNTDEKNNLGVYKIDVNTGEPISGAVFGLYAAEDIAGLDGSVLIKKDTLIQKATTDQNGYAKFASDLPISKYYILEIKPAKGYVNNYVKLEIDSTKISSTEQEYQVRQEVQNKKTEIDVEKVEKTEDLTQRKQIVGVKLQVLSEDGKVVEEWTTNENPHNIRGLETEKEYILHELEPAKGYVTTGDIKFTIDTNGNLKIGESYTIEGTKIPTIIMQDDITKVKITIVDKETKEPIKDIVVQIVDKKTGEVVYEFTTDGEEHMIEKIPIGDYEIVEKEYPKDKGYISSGGEITVKDTPEIQETVIEQDYTKLDVSFIDEVTKALLPGGKLEIRNDKNEVVAIIDNTGVHYYKERLPVGKYTIVEVEVPEGYEKSEDITFMLEDKPEIQYVILPNKRKPFDFRVEKYASEVLINGVKQTGTDQVGKVVKVDINGKQISVQKIEVIYTIKIINSGQIAGSVGTVVDQIPSGLKFDASKNETYWKAENQNIKTTVLANRKIQPGETIELKMKLDWNKSEFNLGEKVNVVTLDGVTNHVGFEENDVSNNSSSASVVISLKTGLGTVLSKQVIIIAAGAILVIGAMVVIEIKIIKRKKML